MQIRMDERSYRPTSSQLLIATYIAWTPMKMVARYDAMALSTSLVTNRGNSTIVPPVAMARFMHAVIPYTWKNGMTPRKTSPPPPRAGPHQRRRRGGGAGRGWV